MKSGVIRLDVRLFDGSLDDLLTPETIAAYVDACALSQRLGSTRLRREWVRCLSELSVFKLILDCGGEWLWVLSLEEAAGFRRSECEARLCQQEEIRKSGGLQ